MSGRQPGRRLLLAGSLGDERQPARRDPRVPRWFEPAHVRDPSAARARIAAQVAAGADVVVAPAWQSHRRALVDVGETRRAREWTLAAVAAAREGVEMGLEERDRAPAGAAEVQDPADGSGGADSSERAERSPPLDRPLERPIPLVAGPLPLLDAETGAGRLLPRDAASERDHRDQAGILSDADVDLILVEVDPGTPMARVAVEAAVSTGLPVWAATLPGGARVSLAELERWTDEAVAVGAEMLLAGRAMIPGPAAGADDTAPQADEAAIAQVAAILERGAANGWGGWLERPGLGDPATGSGETDAVLAASRAWLAAGAHVLGILVGADPRALAPVRAALDAVEAEDRELLETAQARWQEAVSGAARLAPGGAALWLGEAEPTWLPAGFDWLTESASAAIRLPAGRYRLIVDAGPPGSGPSDPDVSLSHMAALLDEGGILARPLRDAAATRDARLRLVHVAEGVVPALAIWRRED